METRCGHKSEITVLLMLRQKDPRFEASLGKSNLEKQQLQQEMHGGVHGHNGFLFFFFFSFFFLAVKNKS